MEAVREGEVEVRQGDDQGVPRGEVTEAEAATAETTAEAADAADRDLPDIGDTREMKTVEEDTYTRSEAHSCTLVEFLYMFSFIFLISIRAHTLSKCVVFYHFLACVPRLVLLSFFPSSSFRSTDTLHDLQIKQNEKPAFETVLFEHYNT